MVLHRNAKLGLAGRYALVRAVEDGCSVRAAAAAFSVSPATACRWSRRWRAASAAERALACLPARSLEPAAADAAAALGRASSGGSALRGAQTGWGPRLLTLRTGHPHSTISKVLAPARALAAAAGRRASRRAATSGPALVTCCTWTSRLYARFDRPGHAVTGDRRTHRRGETRSASATTTRTRSSTTTPASATPSCSTTNAQRP